MADFYSNIPELDAERAGILKRRKIAEMLQQQAMQPLESQQAGAYVVPTSPLLGIGKVLEAYLGKQAMDEADLAQANLGQKAQGMLSAEKQKVADAVLAQQEMPRPSPTMEGPMPGQDPTLDTQRNRLIGLNPKFDQAEKDREERLKLIEQTIAREDAQEQQRLLREATIKAARAGRAENPYYKDVQTGKGVVILNTRTGKMEYAKDEKGEPIIGSQSDVKLKGDIKEAEALGGDIGKQKALMTGKISAMDSVKNAKDMLNKGIYSGFWGSTNKNIAKIMPGANKEKAARTEEFIAYIGNTVVPRLKEFGGNDSNEELRYLQGIMGGDISLEDKALKPILDKVERDIQLGIDRLTPPSTGQVAAPQNTTKRIKFDANGNMVQ